MASDTNCLSWGVLGAARIARRKVMPAFMAAPNNRVVALASRERAKAESGIAEALEVAAERGVVPKAEPRAVEGYEALLGAPDVDAVYIPLPNHLHLEWALKALEAGKHVLLEKPAVLDGKEARKLAEASARYPALKVAEGFMFRHHPQWGVLLDWIRKGRLGPLRSANVQFSFFSEDPENIRNKAETGGGALLDIGCYAIAAARLLFNAAPERLRAIQETHQGVDRQSRAEMVFPQADGRTARMHFQCDIGAAYFQRLDLHGEDGRAVLERPFNPWPHEPVGPVLYDRYGKLVEQADAVATDHFVLQAEAFAAAVLDGAPLDFGVADLVAQADVLDAVRFSAQADAWAVQPKSSTSPAGLPPMPKPMPSGPARMRADAGKLLAPRPSPARSSEAGKGTGAEAVKR
jgi:predicted dehydrogenase